MFEEQFQGMSEEKIKKKSKLSFFFLVGPDSTISEDSSTIEYSASALTTTNNSPDTVSLIVFNIQYLVMVLLRILAIHGLAKISQDQQFQSVIQLIDLFVGF